MASFEPRHAGAFLLVLGIIPGPAIAARAALYEWIKRTGTVSVLPIPAVMVADEIVMN